ncbi:hypothetical protein HYC85_017950 [Camellia sinensis]|uniref:Transmembrane protein n=1 Tax=Camellia sinensis TaxID=4442 RepID=A0A7J7GSX2_CAMSI|nr:hypothetical protein HYC85_017950 [Camellia sinensis]
MVQNKKKKKRKKRRERERQISKSHTLNTLHLWLILLHYVIFVILVLGTVRGRNLRLSSSELVSDGVDHVDYQPPFLSLNGLSSSSETCEYYYDNIGGYISQIVMHN